MYACVSKCSHIHTIIQTNVRIQCLGISAAHISNLDMSFYIIILYLRYLGIQYLAEVSFYNKIQVSYKAKI